MPPSPWGGNPPTGGSSGGTRWQGGGGPGYSTIPPDLLARIRQLFPGYRGTAGYGGTPPAVPPAVPPAGSNTGNLDAVGGQIGIHQTPTTRMGAGQIGLFGGGTGVYGPQQMGLNEAPIREGGYGFGELPYWPGGTIPGTPLGPMAELVKRLGISPPGTPVPNPVPMPPSPGGGVPPGPVGPPNRWPPSTSPPATYPGGQTDGLLHASQYGPNLAAFMRGYQGGAY